MARRSITILYHDSCIRIFFFVKKKLFRSFKWSVSSPEVLSLEVKGPEANDAKNPARQEGSEEEGAILTSQQYL